MQTPSSRKLISFYHGDYDKLCHISFVDYTGHRAKGGGCHFTATHELELTEAELFELLKSHLKVGLGNDPDLVACDRCGNVHFSDELKIDWENPDFPLLCKLCQELELCPKN